jgi:hypothetical protein
MKEDQQRQVTLPLLRLSFGVWHECFAYSIWFSASPFILKFPFLFGISFPAGSCTVARAWCATQ